MSRHDYLPFGEEIGAGVGGRTTEQGYSQPEGVRFHYTDKERDDETGLDYFLTRYYSSAQGRFTSPDKPFAGWDEKDPQTWNLYAYTSNNPLNRVDIDGRRWAQRIGDDGKTYYQWFATDEDYLNAIDSSSDNYQGWTAVTFDESRPFSYTADRGVGGERNSTYILNPDGTHGWWQTLTYGQAGVSGDFGFQFAMTGVFQALGKGVSALLSHEARGIADDAVGATTIHGAEQLAARGFTAADITLTKTGIQIVQRDGAKVFVKEVAAGKFNVLVEGERGVVTALKNISEKSVARLAKNYGWYSPIK